MENSNQRFFQYLASERQGEILVFDRIEQEDGINFVCFKDGSRCNEELIIPINERTWSTQLMAEIESPRNCWTFKEEWVGRQEERWSAPEEAPDGVSHLVQPFVQGRKKVTPIPPKPSKSAFGQINSFSSESNATIAGGSKAQHQASNSELGVDLSDPVYLMMGKAKKFDTAVEMSLIVSLPSKALYDVAKESFENGGDKVIEYIIRNLDDKKLKSSLKDALKSAYGESEPLEIFEPETLEEAKSGYPKMIKNPFEGTEFEGMPIETEK
jgi:hypothetical protein